MEAEFKGMLESAEEIGDREARKAMRARVEMEGRCIGATREWGLGRGAGKGRSMERKGRESMIGVRV